MSYASSCLYPSNINAILLQSENILNSDTITTSKLVVTEPLEIDDLTLKTLVVEQTAVIGDVTEAKAPLTIGLDANGSSLFCYGNIATQSTIAAEQVETNQLNIGVLDTTTLSFVSNASLDSEGNLTNTSIVSTGSVVGDTLQGNNGISATSLNIGSIDTNTSVITSNMSIDSTGTLRNTNIVSSGTITASNVNAPLLNIGVTGDTPNLTIDSTGYLRTEGMLKSTAAIGFQSGYSNGDGTFSSKVSIGYDATSDKGYVNAALLTGALTGNVTGDLTGVVTGTVVGNVTGDLTGSVTGSVTGNVTGDLLGNVADASHIFFSDTIATAAPKAQYISGSYPQIEILVQVPTQQPNSNGEMIYTMTLKAGLNTTNYSVFPSIYYGFSGSSGTYDIWGTGAWVIISNITTTTFDIGVKTGTTENWNGIISFLVVYNMPNTDYPKSY